MPNNFQKLFPTTLMKILLLLYLASLVWWITIFGRGVVDTVETFFFSIPMGLIPLSGGIASISAIVRQKHWSNPLSKAVVLFSLSLIFLGVGMLSWIYYNIVLHVLVPYPSVADFIFLPVNFLGFAGAIFLCRAAGLQFKLTSLASKALLFLIPAIAVIVTYYLLFIIAGHDSNIFSGFTLKTFFDFYYPIGDVLILLVISLLIYGLLFGAVNHRYIIPITLITLGFIVNYIADLGFTYTTTEGIYFNANWVDLLYVTALFFLSLGINLLVVENRSQKVAFSQYNAYAK